MSAATTELFRPLPAQTHNPIRPVITLARRRFQLSARTPRELVVPLLTPILFALVIAPSLKTALHTSSAYESFVATGTIGLLIPLNTMFAGIGALVDREAGAQRELLTAPISRALLVVARARGIHFDITAGGFVWFLAAGSLFTIGMYGMAEVLAARVPSTEEYIGRVPAVAIVPWFLAGSLFPISALPGFLTWFARFLPLTHGLALVRYGLLDDSSSLHNIWKMHSAPAMAGLSLTIVGLFGFLLTVAGIKVFSRHAVR
jgi:ABC-2 type transport system permease protein